MGKQYKEDDLFETDNRNNHNYIVITPENNYNTILCENKAIMYKDFVN